jgi:hypothetical protein
LLKRKRDIEAEDSTSKKVKIDDDDDDDDDMLSPPPPPPPPPLPTHDSKGNDIGDGEVYGDATTSRSVNGKAMEVS